MKILYNAKIHSMDTNRTVYEAIALECGKILACGSDKEILSMRDMDTECIDADGHIILPGFNDSHVHLLKAGMSFQQIDLGKVTSINEIITIGKSHISEKTIEPGAWIFGRGWNQFYLKENRMPDKRDLDQISTEHPIVFVRLCEHVISVNSKVLELARIDKNTKQIKGGYFDTDTLGEPTGIFRDVARDLIYRVVAEPTVSEMKEMIKDALTVAVEYGVTSIQTDDFWTLPSKDYRKVIRAYEELEAENELQVRIYEQCVLESMNDLNRFIEDGYKTGYGSTRFKIGPFKAFVDGAMGSRTAYFTEPYEDDQDNYGFPIHSQEELNQLMIFAHSHGMQLIAHAIGNRGIYFCIESFQKAHEAQKLTDFRPGIIHAQATDQYQNDLFSRRGIMIIGDPVVLKDDIHMVDSRLGEERAKYAYSYRNMIDKNVKLSMSTDWPINSINPMCNIYVALTRKDYSGFPQGGWHPEQCIGVDDAIWAYTARSAYCSYEEDKKGTLEVGKFADLVILSQDIFHVSAEEILNTEIELTMIGGEIVYKKRQRGGEKVYDMTENIEEEK